jgi:hypothetical protein
MATWLLWFLPIYEAGFWSAVLTGKIRDRGKIRELLVYGCRTRTHLPLIDERLRNAAGNQTKSQAYLVRHAAALIRWLANTRAIEHVLLIGIKRSWSKRQNMDAKISLCL